MSLALVSCFGSTVCNQHRDTDDNGFCDECNIQYEDGQDHSHKVVNGFCEICNLPESSPGLEFSLNYDNTYTLTGLGSCKDSDIIVGIYKNADVTEIYMNAFQDSDISSITLTQAVKFVDNYAFAYCENLQCVKISDSLIHIGYGVFSGCSALNEIIVDENNANYQSIDGNLYTKDGKTLIKYASGKEATQFDVPIEVINIDPYAFDSSLNLKNINLPDNIKKIGSYAFSGCFFLSDFNVPDSVTEIGSNAFNFCLNLEKITIGQNVGEIGFSTFSYCTKLKKINVHKNNSSYKSLDGTLYTKDGKILIKCPSNNAITLFCIPDGVEKISDQAFHGCINLTDIRISNSVTSIGWYAFAECSNLANINLPDNIQSIGYDAFRNTAYFNDKTNWDGECLYNNNFLIKSNSTISGNYIIPDGIKIIAGGAFSDCVRLTSVTIPDSVQYIGSDAFLNTGFYNNESNWENGGLYIGNCLISVKETISGHYAIKSGTVLVQDDTFDLSATELKSLYIPSSVKYIPSNTLAYHYDLTQIYYEGTKSQWGELYGIVSDNCTINCTDGPYSNN